LKRIEEIRVLVVKGKLGRKLEINEVRSKESSEV
jgi:hypothetical protein